ncbi:MAG TPA: hypothetical protein VHY48_12355 [Acidobacteriaceae bacterium]|nr:hypothetical protein [Acidobacteriaceae bacterium]
MKNLSLLTALALSLATATALGQSFTGVVSDAMCAKNPAKASSAAHAACAKKCIKMGSPAVLIVDGKVYPVSNPDKLTAYAGQKVTVEGTLAAGTLTVKSVKD